MIHRKIVLLIAVFMLSSFAASPALSVPAAPIVHTLEQQDGSKFMAKLWGDEWSHGWETTDNYSIVFDETTKDWTYAITGADGDLIPSIKVVGRDPPPNNIQEHLRPTGKAQSRILDLKTSKAPGVPDKVAPAPDKVALAKVAPDKVVSSTGTANIPVILINFNDTTTAYTSANFNTLLFGSGVKSMKDYYEEVSYGNFSVSSGPGGVVGWYTASKNHNYYGQNDAYGSDRWPGTLVREAVAAADAAGFNFAPYDQNSDCYVDVVNIVHQGSGEEASGLSTDIWSHRWTLSSAYYYGYSDGGAYTTNDPCTVGGFIKVNDYVIQPETYGSGQQTMGVFAHEYGHALGLPDLYDTTYSSEGIGYWSLMAGGSWTGISRSGDTPAQLDAWSKSFLGWVSPQQITGTTSKQIKQVEYNSEVYRLLDNPNGVSDWSSSGNGKGEYFLVENRRKTGFDAALPGEGLLIWHIDEAMGNNNNKNHKLVDLEEADGRNDLDSRNNSGDAFDPWYSSTVGFTENTIPNSKLYNGSASGVRVTSISASAAIMTANLTAGATTTPSIFQAGDVFAAVGYGVIRHYDKNGNFIENLAIPSGTTYNTGMAFDSNGNLYATDFWGGKVAKFNNAGSFLSFFGSGYNSDPESIAIDASGRVYVGQADGTADILKFDSSGNLLAAYNVATEDRGSDWIDLASDQCTMYYTSEGKKIKRFNVCTNTQLSDFATGLPGSAAFALRILSNGGVLVADTNATLRLDATGKIVQTYPRPSGETSTLFALNLDPDGTSFWTGGYSSGKVYKFDISTGNLLLTINTTSQGTISALGGIAVFGEITSVQSAPKKTVGVYNNAGTWALWNSTSNAADIVGFGFANTTAVVGDWNSDVKTDVGIYNKGGNNFLIRYPNGTFAVIGLGWGGVTPVIGDWNGDGKDKVGVYDNIGTWALWNSTSNSADLVGFGFANTIPVVGDWNGDDRTDVGIYNKGGNNFLIRYPNGTFTVVGLGWTGVTPVIGDWNGDGKDEVGVYDNAGTWALWNSTSSSADLVGFGFANTIPVVGDWNGDGKTDVGVYNKGGNNFLLRNASGTTAIGLGWTDITPVVGRWS